MPKPGDQDYDNSLFEFIASWGVDYVKMDDIPRPYHSHQAEIKVIRRAIDRTRRPVVLSLSPGETAITAAEHVQKHANLWRISDRDLWSQQGLGTLQEKIAPVVPWHGAGLFKLSLQ